MGTGSPTKGMPEVMREVVNATLRKIIHRLLIHVEHSSLIKTSSHSRHFGSIPLVLVEHTQLMSTFKWTRCCYNVICCVGCVGKFWSKILFKQTALLVWARIIIILTEAVALESILSRMSTRSTKVGLSSGLYFQHFSITEYLTTKNEHVLIPVSQY